MQSNGRMVEVTKDKLLQRRTAYHYLIRSLDTSFSHYKERREHKPYIALKIWLESNETFISNCISIQK